MMNVAVIPCVLVALALGTDLHLFLGNLRGLDGRYEEEYWRNIVFF